MSLCCIGGVCVPYSAVIPLLFLALRWLLEKAVKLGLLPDSVREKFFPATASSKYAPVSSNNGSGECIASAACCSTSATSNNGAVILVESEDQFRDVLKQPQVVCKFTAAWCKPCKEIHPVFASLAQQHSSSATFCTVDVDDLDEVAQEYNVAMMPTFLVFKNGQVHDKMTGISLLEDFVEKALK